MIYYLIILFASIAITCAVTLKLSLDSYCRANPVVGSLITTDIEEIYIELIDEESLNLINGKKVDYISLKIVRK